jgi:hypothetical protein
MTIVLKRKQIFILSLIMVCLCIVLTRINYLVFGKTTTAKVPNYNGWARGSMFIEPTMFYTVGSQTISYTPYADTDGINAEIIPIIYVASHPKQPMVYNFIGFWFKPLLCFSIPYFFLVLSLIFGFMNTKDVLVIRTHGRPWIQKMNKYKFAEEKFKEL